MTLARHADDDWRLEALEFSGMPYESSLFNAVRLECRMVRDGSANRLLATADEDVFTPEMEGREFLRVTRKYGEAVVEGTQMPFYHLTNLDRDLYKGETFSMDREDGWRQAYTCIRDFSRKNDYQPGVNRPERYTAFFEKVPMPAPASMSAARGRWKRRAPGMRSGKSAGGIRTAPTTFPTSRSWCGIP